MKKEVLITGSNGLLGSALGRIVENPILHTREEADLMNRTETSFYLLDNKPNTIIHCGAKVGGVLANMENNKQFFRENIIINNNVIDNACYMETENFVSILSTCIFPNENITYPLTYDQLDNGRPHDSNSGYSYAKRLLYYQTKMYRNFLNKNWISVIPTNIYGINDQFNLENSHIIPALIRKAYEAKKYDKNFIIWGDGSPLRQFIYSDDLAKSILYAIDNWKKDIPFMAVNQQEYSIKHIANIIADRFGLLENMKFDTSKPSGQYKKTASSDIDFMDFISIEEGINKTIDWFIENYKDIRK